MRRLLGMAAAIVLVAGTASADPDWSRRGHVSGGLPDYDASDPDAPPVTEENLLASERFWPYRVELVEPWAGAPRGAAVASGTAGVLIRVEPSGRARIDLGRDGLHEVPLAVTDVVARAERIRRGEKRKIAPNLLHAIGPRLGDSAGEEPGPYRFERAADKRGFLSVYADPEAEGFEALATSLARFQDRDEVLTVLFPQGRHPDAEVRERLRALGWKVPFVLDHLSEPYTHSQLGAAHALPAVQLQTAEGRVLFRSAWDPGVPEALAAELSRAFDDAERTARLRGRP